MQYLSSIYQYFFQPEPEVDYTDIPSNVKNYIENYYNGGLTNKEKQDAVNSYNGKKNKEDRIVDKELVKDLCEISQKLTLCEKQAKFQSSCMMAAIRANEGSEKYNNGLQNSSKEITTQGQKGMLSTVEIINLPMINTNCDNEKVEFDAFNLSNIRSQNSDVDSDGKNLSLQNKGLSTTLNIFNINKHQRSFSDDRQKASTRQHGNANKELKHSTVHMKGCPRNIRSFV